jgi:peroxisomal coenzyme A diphosphatase NUDT7
LLTVRAPLSSLQVNISPDCVTVAAVLPAVLSLHLISVTPVVGIVPAAIARAAAPRAGEVAAAFSVPLRHFLEDHPRHSAERVQFRGVPAATLIHYFATSCGRSVWGLTASIAVAVAEVALGRPAAFDDAGGYWDQAHLRYNGKRVSQTS